MAEVFHNVFSTIVAESPPVVWPLRPVLDAEYPTPTIRTEGKVPPADHPRVLEVMREASEFIRRWAMERAQRAQTRRAGRSAASRPVTASLSVPDHRRRDRQGGAVDGLVPGAKAA